MIANMPQSKPPLQAFPQQSTGLNPDAASLNPEISRKQPKLLASLRPSSSPSLSTTSQYVHLRTQTLPNAESSRFSHSVSAFQTVLTLQALSVSSQANTSPQVPTAQDFYSLSTGITSMSLAVGQLTLNSSRLPKLTFGSTTQGVETAILTKPIHHVTAHIDLL